MGVIEPAEADVVAALHNLLAWPEIARSQQLGRFLDYVVRAKLRGEEAGIKAYSIAVDVFDRPADFDPQSDPIVRVQARRLRALLAQYYASAGNQESVRIELPTGRYVPEFVVVEPDTVVRTEKLDPVYPEAQVNDLPEAGAPAVVTPRPSRRFPTKARLLLGAFLIALGAATIATFLGGMESEKAFQERRVTEPMRVQVMEFQRLTQSVDDVALTAGLAVDVVSKLNNSGLVIAQYGGAGVPEPGAADYVLSGTVRREGGDAQYSAILTETATGKVSWSKLITTAVEGRNQLGLTDEVSLTLAAGLSSITGPVLAPVRVSLSEGYPGIAPTLYTCRVLYSGYRADLLPADAERSRDCYAQLHPDEQQSGEVQAGQAILILAGAPGSGAENMSAEARAVLAEEMLARAVEIAPLNAFVWTQYARYYREMGDLEGEEMAYEAARKLNPANAEILAAYSQSLAIAGRREEAMQLFAIAIDSSTNPPGWFYITPAMIALANEDWPALGQYADLLRDADNLTAPLFGVLAGYRLGNSTQLNQALPQLLETRSFRSSGIMPQLARRISDTQLLAVIRKNLLAAGVPSDRLDGPY